MSHRYFLYFLCWLAAVLPLNAQRDDLRVHIQHQLDEWCKGEKIPGATLAVHTRSGSRQWSSGLADVEAKIPMPADAMLFSGSVGKTYVSALVLKLVAEGKLQLESRIQPFFGGEPWYDCLPNAQALTLRMLLNHTSGLGRYIFQESFLKAIKEDPYKEISPQEGLQHLCGTAQVHAPGKGWSYSDSNYLILGLLIEKLTGKPYYEVLEEEILKPLQLEKTRPTTSKNLPGLAPGYIGEHNFFGLPEKVIGADGNYVMDPSFEYTGGGLYCTTADLAEWIYLLHSGRVLSDSTYQLLIQPVDLRSGQPAEIGYGLGTFVWDTPLGKNYGHAGMFPGYLTQVEHNPAMGATIALQVNTDGGDMRSMRTFLLQLFALLSGKD